MFFVRSFSDGEYLMANYLAHELADLKKEPGKGR